LWPSKTAPIAVNLIPVCINTGILKDINGDHSNVLLVHKMPALRSAVRLDGRRPKTNQKKRMLVKRKVLQFGIVCLLFLTVSGLSGQKINTVVIDAGHGGHDTGALGKHSREKDITLAVALKLGRYIKDNLSDVKVIYTRKTDDFIELFRRARIANENHADLFISIHCNANPSPTPFGTETYVMGLHRSNANLSVAKAENASILLEDDYIANYDGFDPKSAEGNIFFSMLQNTFLDNSLAFASSVENQFTDRLNLLSRGVKQAGFLVLYKTAMPGVLIETGFLSNLKDEKFLLSDKGQESIAFSIFRAFRDYKHLREFGTPAPADTSRMFAVKEPEPELPDTIKPVPLKQVPAKPVPAKPVTPVTQVQFKVQFATSPGNKPLSSDSFKGLKNVNFYIHEGLCKYTVGNDSTLEDASRLRKEVIGLGYKDAFVVVFNGNKRITLKEAAQLVGK
jgi:N-acetylmuramoyl-L-alanine amidase